MRTSALVAVILLGTSLPAAGKGCPDGRFELRTRTGGSPRVAGMLALAEQQVALEGLCPPVSARRGNAGGHFWLPSLRVRWTDCSAASGITALRARMTDAGCRTIRGVLRTARGRVRFRGTRIPVCGNGVVEDGEACDDGNDAAGDCCVACQLEAHCFTPCASTADCAPTQVCRLDTCDTVMGVCGPPQLYECDTSACRMFARFGRVESFCERDGATPYCGCDGRHYANVCDAWAAGSAIRACYQACREDGAPGCVDGMVCDIDARRYPGCSAGNSYRWGRCVPRPATCAGADGAPVCGCDRVLYPNDCARLQAGAFLAIDQTCPSH